LQEAGLRIWPGKISQISQAAKNLVKLTQAKLRQRSSCVDGYPSRAPVVRSVNEVTNEIDAFDRQAGRKPQPQL